MHQIWFVCVHCTISVTAVLTKLVNHCKSACDGQQVFSMVTMNKDGFAPCCLATVVTLMQILLFAQGFASFITLTRTHLALMLQKIALTTLIRLMNVPVWDLHTSGMRLPADLHVNTEQQRFAVSMAADIRDSCEVSQSNNVSSAMLQRCHFDCTCWPLRIGLVTSSTSRRVKMRLISGMGQSGWHSTAPAFNTSG